MFADVEAAGERWGFVDAESDECFPERFKLVWRHRLKFGDGGVWEVAHGEIRSGFDWPVGVSSEFSIVAQFVAATHKPLEKPVVPELHDADGDAEVVGGGFEKGDGLGELSVAGLLVVDGDNVDRIGMDFDKAMNGVALKRAHVRLGATKYFCDDFGWLPGFDGESEPVQFGERAAHFGDFSHGITCEGCIF